MLRLFSSIRKSLLLRRQGYEGHVAENKTVKYAKYAIGEFLLIVAGILVALQIQNWNENRRLEQERRELIENLKVDFRANLLETKGAIESLESLNGVLKKFLKAISSENSGLSKAELKDLARYAFAPTGTLPTLSSYQSAMSTGAINLIKDPVLKKHLVEFEKSSVILTDLTVFNRNDVLIGQSAELRREIGSVTQLVPRENSFRIIGEPLGEPEIHKLTDQEFREFLARKDVYSLFETRLIIRGRILQTHYDLQKITEQILTALEALE